MNQHSSTHSRRSHNSNGRKYKIWPWVTGVFIILLALTSVAGYYAYKFYGEAKQVQAHENNALSMMSDFSSNITDGSFSELTKKMPQIQNETEQAQQIVDGDLWHTASKLPWVGDDVKAVQGMTRVINKLSHQAVPRFMAVVDVLNKSSLSMGENGVNLQPILDSQVNMKAANAELQSEVREYNALPKPKMDVVKNAYDQGQEKLTSLAKRVNGLSNTFQMLPGFLGASGEPQTYAVMAMTTSEMRSSGGLIGSVGKLTTDNGKVEVGDFQPNSVYIPFGAADRTADEKRIFTDDGPLHMSFDIRDLAVYPDTQDMAEAMRTIWSRTPWGADDPLDGVITADPVFVQGLVKINGDVTLPDDTKLTGDNTAEFLLNTAYQQYDDSQTDIVFGTVASQVLSNMFKNISIDKLMRIGDMMDTMTQERHFSMYAFNEDLEKSIMQAGFTAVTPSSEDNPSVGIYLTEQNPSKMGWYIHRTTKVNTVNCDDDGSRIYHVEYTLDNTITDEQASTLKPYITGVDAQNRGKAMEKILFFPPAGGRIENLQLIGGTADSVIQDTFNGKSIYRSYIEILPGSRATYSFDVVVSPKAKQTLKIDQTPMGWTDSGVTEEDSNYKP